MLIAVGILTSCPFIAEPESLLDLQKIPQMGSAHWEVVVVTG